MSYIPSSTSTVADILFHIGGPLSILLMAIALISGITGRAALAWATGAAGAVALALAVTAPAWPGPDFNAQRLASVEETYGITITLEQLGDLHYPYAEPEATRLLFGSTTVSDGDGTPSVVHLSWTGGELRLIDDTGAELPRA